MQLSWGLYSLSLSPEIAVNRHPVTNGEGMAPNPVCGGGGHDNVTKQDLSEKGF